MIMTVQKRQFPIMTMAITNSIWISLNGRRISPMVPAVCVSTTKQKHSQLATIEKIMLIGKLNRIAYSGPNRMKIKASRSIRNALLYLPFVNMFS